jgi:S-disulfanyl-L-cysteine oxidoreductase SoxD
VSACGRHRALRLAALAALLAGCSGSREPWQLHPEDAAVVATGRQVYAQQCARCHGAQLQGQPNWQLRDATGRLPAPPQDASGHTWRRPDELLFRIVRSGIAKGAELQDYPSNMPAFEGVLSDEQVVAVLSFIKASWPKDVRRRHDALNQAWRRGERG